MSLVTIAVVESAEKVPDKNLEILKLSSGDTTVNDAGEFTEGSIVVVVRAGAWLPYDWAPWAIKKPRVSNCGIIGGQIRERVFNIPDSIDKNWVFRVGRFVHSNCIVLPINRFPVWKEDVEQLFQRHSAVVTVGHRLTKKGTVASQGYVNPGAITPVAHLLKSFYYDMTGQHNVYPYTSGTTRSLYEFLYGQQPKVIL